MSARNSLIHTRRSLHAVAEHVLSRAVHGATGRIGLRPAPGGVATPPFGEPPERISIEGVELVVERRHASSRHPLTTLGAAAAAAEVDLDVWHGLYPAATPADPSLELLVDPHAAAVIADWFARTGEALGSVAAANRGAEPAAAQLWPEHFDLALTIGAGNVGGSPGDAQHDEPYLYVGPWEPGRYAGTDGYWNEPFGASLSWRPDLSVADAVAFFTEGLARL